MITDQTAHGVGYGHYQFIFALYHPDQALVQFFAAFLFWKAVGEETVDFRVPQHTLVCQSDQPTTQVTDGGHVEGVTQLCRAAAGVKGCDQMGGVVSILFKYITETIKGGAATEKKYSGSQLRRLTVTADSQLIRNLDCAADL